VISGIRKVSIFIRVHSDYDFENRFIRFSHHMYSPLISIIFRKHAIQARIIAVNSTESIAVRISSILAYSSSYEPLWQVCSHCLTVPKRSKSLVVIFGKYGESDIRLNFSSSTHCVNNVEVCNLALSNIIPYTLYDIIWYSFLFPSILFDCIRWHCIALHCTALHCIALHDMAL
jgi:hypothetical protein